VFTCSPEHNLADLMAMMTARRIRHIPIIENGALCGIVSIGDVVKSRVEEIEREAEALRAYVVQA
jgi:CBS domain-containing protein